MGKLSAGQELCWAALLAHLQPTRSGSSKVCGVLRACAHVQTPALGPPHLPEFPGSVSYCSCSPLAPPQKAVGTREETVALGAGVRWGGEGIED